MSSALKQVGVCKAEITNTNEHFELTYFSEINHLRNARSLGGQFKTVATLG